MRAVSRIEVSRTKTDTPSQKHPTAGVREFRTKHLRKRRATKISSETAKVRSAPEARLNARTGTSLSIALLLPCPLLPVPGGNLSNLDAGTSLSVSGASWCHFPGHALHEKGLQGRSIGQQPGTKSGRRPADKPVINRLSTAGFVPPSVYMGFPLFVLPKRRSGQLSSMPRRARWSVVFWANRPVGVLSYVPGPAPPCRIAVRRPAPTRSWYVQVLGSTGLIAKVPRSANLTLDPVRKGRSVQGAHNREFVRDAITGT